MVESTSDSRRQLRGAELRAWAQGPRSAQLREVLDGLDPDLARWVDDFVFGEVWGREGLPPEDRMIVAIGMLAVQGRRQQLRAYLFGALHAGVDESRVTEVLVMAAVYAGFPTALDALELWRHVQASGRRQGWASRGTAGP